LLSYDEAVDGGFGGGSSPGAVTADGGASPVAAHASDAAARLAAVKAHVLALQQMIAASGEKEVEERKREAEYAHPQWSGGPFGAPAAGGFGAPAAGGFGAPAAGGFGAPAAGGFGAPAAGGFGFGAPAAGGFGAPAARGFGAPANMRGKGFGGGGSRGCFGGGKGGSHPAMKARSAAPEMAMMAAAPQEMSAAPQEPSSPAPKAKPPPAEADKKGALALLLNGGSGSSGGGGGSCDLTLVPAELDARCEALAPTLRPTTIALGAAWTKKAAAALLASPRTATLDGGAQASERRAAFDLLDALSRSGALSLPNAELHVVLAATDRFEDSVVDTVVQRAQNPIARAERAALVVAAAVHGLPRGGAGVSQMVAPQHLARVQAAAPDLFRALPDAAAEVPPATLRAAGTTTDGDFLG